MGGGVCCCINQCLQFLTELPDKCVLLFFLQLAWEIMLSNSSYILIALAALLVSCHALSKCPETSGLPGIPGKNGLKGKQTSSFARDPPHKGCMTWTDNTEGQVLSRKQMCSAQEGKENGGNGQFIFSKKWVSSPFWGKRRIEPVINTLTYKYIYM